MSFVRPPSFAPPVVGPTNGGLQRPQQQFQPMAGGATAPTMPQRPTQPSPRSQPGSSGQSIAPSAYNNPGALRPTYPGYQPITQKQYNQQFTNSGQPSGQSGQPRGQTTYPQSSQGFPGQAPASGQGGQQTGQAGQTTAQITSAFGTPVLPFADPNLNAQTVNRQFEGALGTQGLQSILNSMRPSNNGMAATPGDQQMLTPFMTSQGTAGANALAGVPYEQGLGNANALLNWQGGQTGDILGQFNNLLGVNNAQQNYGLTNLLNQMNYGTGTLGNQVGFGQNVIGGLAGPGSILSNLLGGLTGSVGNLVGGTIGMV
jgi:hypothetical protein